MNGFLPISHQPAPSPPPVVLTTRQPVYTPTPPPQRLDQGPPRLDPWERMRLRTAAFRAVRRYPGPVGKLIEREILAVEDMGFRFVNGSLIADLVDEVMKAPLGQVHTP